jgi:hypothetical protein
MYLPTFKRALMDAATADAARSARHAHHQREWDLQVGNPFVRALRRLFLARRWRTIRPAAVRRDQAVAADAEGSPS